MALSDWTTLAINEDAIPTYGCINGFIEGTSVEIYKNWLYVRDEKMHYDECGYTDGTIASINSGNINISRFEINAEREDEQNAIFCLVTTKLFDKDDYSKKPELRIMAGIGCSGYDDPTPKLMEYFGVNSEDVDWTSRGWGNWNWNTNEKGSYISLSVCYKDKRKKMEEFFMPETKRNKAKYESKWIGVSSSLYKKFIKWLGTQIDEYDDEMVDWYKKVKKLKRKDILFFNQGDKYFAEHGIGDGNIGQSMENTVKPMAEVMINGE
jgi:hypothetical protein